MMAEKALDTPHVPRNNSAALVEVNPNPGGVALVNPMRTNKPSDAYDLVALATQVQKADECTRSVAGSKLSVIAEQIKFLQRQALTILEEAKLNADLNHAACNMVKKPGNLYHLYERDSGQKYLSILSPIEWGSSCPHLFCGSFRLEYDMSWTPVNKQKERDAEEAMVTTILNANHLLGPASVTGPGCCSDPKADTPLLSLMGKTE